MSKSIAIVNAPIGNRALVVQGYEAKGRTGGIATFDTSAFYAYKALSQTGHAAKCGAALTKGFASGAVAGTKQGWARAKAEAEAADKAVKA